MFDNPSESVASLPKSVTVKSFFLVDLNKFDFVDLKADDNGVFVNGGLRTTYYQIGNIDDKSLRFYQTSDKTAYEKKLSEEKYMVRKYHYYHSNDNNFIRKIVRLTGSLGNFDKCLLCYFFKNEISAEPTLKLTVHGNSKYSTSFQCRSSRSLMEEVKEVSQKHGSLTDNYNNFVQKKIPEASLSEIPKNRKQVANQKFLIKKQNSTYFDSKDELHDAIMSNLDGEFIRSMDILFDTFRSVVFTHQQIFDLVRFCKFCVQY